MTQVPQRTALYAPGSIRKPLPPEEFVDFRVGEASPDDLTGDLALNAETRWEAMAGRDYLTPNELFYVRNHAPTPRIEPSRWRLRVEGPGVKRTLEIGYDELLRLPETSFVRALECAGNGRALFEEVQGRATPGTPWRLGAIGVAEWTGVPLREVLERADIKASAREVMPEGLDAVRMRRPMPLEKALEEDVIVAYAMNGEPLPQDHGFPARVIVSRWAAVASVKWVGRIHVSETPLSSPWNTDKYVLTGGGFGAGRIPVEAQGLKSALELPWPARLRRGRHTIGGRSWSAQGAITRVEYSVDGEPWRAARLVEPNVSGAWVRWSFGWDARTGRHDVRARAMDTAGSVQPDETPFNELGYLYGAVVGHPVWVR